jgi:hypothetical protein
MIHKYELDKLAEVLVPATLTADNIHSVLAERKRVTNIILYLSFKGIFIYE